MNMKVYTCKKCHRTYTQIKGGSVCPYWAPIIQIMEH